MVKHKDKQQLTKELIDKYLIIDPIRGTAKWIKPYGLACKKEFAGATAPIDSGWKNAGYTQISLNKQRHYLHRIIWVDVHGAIPTDKVIDHLDNNPLNNKIDNLQCITLQANVRKRKPHAVSRFSYPGISHHYVRTGYTYRIGGTDSRQRYTTQYEAFVAYVRAKRDLHGIEACAPILHLLREDDRDQL